MKTICVLVSLLAISSQVDGLKVLGILPFGSNSHFAIGHSIVKSLHKAGHHVTVISPYPQKKPLANYTDISTADIMEKYKEDQKFNAFDIGNMNEVMIMSFLYFMGAELVNNYMTHAGVLEFLKTDQNFDVCIIEVFNVDAMVGIADRFDCVLISYTTFGAVKWINDMTANEQPSSYVPHPFLHYTDQMTFKERLLNTFFSKIEDVLYGAFHLTYQRYLYNKYFPNARKSFYEHYKNSAILFLNNHVSSSSARPYLPNMIEIGGIHVEPAKPLPDDLQEFLDSAKEGAILFSMGSVVQSVDWPVEKRQAFINSFKKLKQKVIWKYENDTLPNMPDNMMISKWIPQRDILAHPNIKLFITHGGLLGTTEALVEGVPVLGLPVFGDQMMNMAKAVARGYGLKIALEEVTEERLSRDLNDLLSNKKYKENAEIISGRFTDRPMTPQETVVYWTEYAVRHKGAPHLKAAGNSLNFIEFHLLDVYLVLSLAAFVFLYIDYVILKFIIKRIFKKKTSGDKKLKKN